MLCAVKIRWQSKNCSSQFIHHTHTHMHLFYIFTFTQTQTENISNDDQIQIEIRWIALFCCEHQKSFASIWTRSLIHMHSCLHSCPHILWLHYVQLCIYANEMEYFTHLQSLHCNSSEPKIEIAMNPEIHTEFNRNKLWIVATYVNSHSSNLAQCSAHCTITNTNLIQLFVNCGVFFVTG